MCDYNFLFNELMKLHNCHAELDSASNNVEKMKISNQVRNDKRYFLL